ncbi:MAG: sensor histidine kinase [Henriciella sp.]
MSDIKSAFITQAPLSLARRILLGALVWSVVMVVGGVIAISFVYRAQTVNLLDTELESITVDLARALEVLPDGRVVSVDEKLPTDSRYETPLSGRYWVIIAVDEGGNYADDIRPRSVWDGDPPLPNELAAQAMAEQGAIIQGNGVGPAGEPIRIAVQAISTANRENPILLVAAADRTQTDAGANQLRTILIITMSLLAAGTLLAIALGLRYALRPFDRIKHDIADVREGRRATLAGNYPSEVQPLSEELNKLLEHNRAIVSRARTHVGNLAHALKTPLAVLRNEATDETQLAEVVRRQIGSMHTNVDHYLKRAQAAARAEQLGARTQLLETVSGLSRMMNKLYGREGKSVSVDISETFFVRTERQDLEEMLGNLVDNACKWAKSSIVLSAELTPDAKMLIHVDDDGPGLPQEDRQRAIQRGVRLDETAPGTGLGLSIVADLAGMNGGGLELSTSPLGGLRATLSLRAAT